MNHAPPETTRYRILRFLPNGSEAGWVLRVDPPIPCRELADPAHALYRPGGLVDHVALAAGTRTIKIYASRPPKSGDKDLGLTLSGVPIAVIQRRAADEPLERALNRHGWGPNLLVEEKKGSRATSASEPRWLVTVTHRVGAGPDGIACAGVVHPLTELGELEDVIETGPDWNTISSIVITLIQPTTLTMEEAAKL